MRTQTIDELRAEDAALLAPISPDAPAGESLRYDPLYDRIRRGRLSEDPNLPQGVWQRETSQADWDLVERLCTDALTHRSKDMQLALWRTEALLHLHGLVGFSKGCCLLLDLHRSFPAAMHPAPATGTEDDPLPEDDPAVEQRINMIQWLNEKLSVQLKLLPITAPAEVSGLTAFSFADLEQARHQEKLQQQPGGRKGGGQPLQAFESSLAMTPQEWIRQRWHEIYQAADVTEALDELFDSLYGKANSGLLTVKQVLHQMAAAISPALPEEIFVEEDTDKSLAADQVAWNVVGESSASTEDHMPATEASELKSLPNLPSPDQQSLRAMSGPIGTREEAYLRLAEIADFLARIEPHSPVPYLLRRAIAWGGMSLQELLPELLQDQTALRNVGYMLRLHGE